MDVHYPCNLNLSKQPVSRSIDPVITSIDKKPVRKSTSIVPNLESRTGNSITRYLPYRFLNLRSLSAGRFQWLESLPPIKRTEGRSGIRREKEIDARKRLKTDGGINGGRRDASRQASVLTFPGGSAPRAIKVSSLCTQRGDTRFVTVLPRWWRERERKRVGAKLVQLPKQI